MATASAGAVTTVIPTYRRPALLRRAIGSALAQTYAEVRVCVYDNASGDETESVVREIAARDARVTYYCQERHVDAPRNFLFGMERVETPYFSFLSDDDFLFPDFYASAVARLRQYPRALFAASSVIEFDEAGRVRYAPVALWRREGLYMPPEGFDAMLGNRHPTWTGILFRREVLAQVGVLDVLVGGPMDLDYELRIAARFPYVVSFAPGAGYVHHSGRISAAEDTSVIAGYRRLEQNLIADSAIDPALRARIPHLLERQMRLKLYEIAFKSAVTGNDTNALDAADMLRSDFNARLIAWWIRQVVHASLALPLLPRLLARLEAARLKNRSRIARYRLRATAGNDGSQLANYLRGTGELQR